MTKGAPLGHLFFYAVPLLLGNWLQLAYNAVDSIIAGRFIGQDALAAEGIAGPVMNLVILAVSGLCIGAGVLMSEAFGAKNEERLKETMATTLLFGAALCCAVALLGVAAAQGQQKLRPRIAHIAALNRQLRAGLEELDGITLNSPDDAVGEIVNFSTGCINSQTFINYLNTRAVYVSGGSACDKGEPSHTLLAMGCADLTVRTALRVSFCADNTAEDVDALLAGLRDGLQELQHI